MATLPVGVVLHLELDFGGIAPGMERSRRSSPAATPRPPLDRCARRRKSLHRARFCSTTAARRGEARGMSPLARAWKFCPAVGSAHRAFLARRARPRPDRSSHGTARGRRRGRAWRQPRCRGRDLPGRSRSGMASGSRAVPASSAVPFRWIFAMSVAGSGSVSVFWPWCATRSDTLPVTFQSWLEPLGIRLELRAQSGRPALDAQIVAQMQGRRQLPRQGRQVDVAFEPGALLRRGRDGPFPSSEPRGDVSSSLSTVQAPSPPSTFQRACACPDESCRKQGDRRPQPDR